MHKMLKKRVNYYQLLHVQPDAPAEIIRASYLALMRDLKMHPDLGGAHMNAALLNEAYETLGNSTRRAEYDRYLPLYDSPGNGNQHILSVPATDSTAGRRSPEPACAESTGDQGSPVTGHRPSVSSGHVLCRDCHTKLRRKRRPWWMRLLPFTKSYLCPLCKQSFLSFKSYLIRV